MLFLVVLTSALVAVPTAATLRSDDDVVLAEDVFDANAVASPVAVMVTVAVLVTLRDVEPDVRLKITVLP